MLQENWRIRRTIAADYPDVEAIYAQSRCFMEEQGNPDQWGKYWPSEQQIRDDIKSGCSYVCVDGEEILAVFAFVPGPDPCYEEVETAWLNEKPYWVVHRMATGGDRRGAGAFSLNWCFEQSGNLRIDTHEANQPMQRLLDKLGFVCCGMTQADNGTPRLAFQKCRLQP